MATLQELERALVNAHKAGDSDAARKLAVVLKRAREDRSLMIPGAETSPVPGTVATREPSIGERVVGAGEAAASLISGAVAAPVAAVGGLGAAAIQTLTGQPSNAQRTAGEIAEALTYQPSTQAGQEAVQVVGEALAPLRLEGIGPSVQAMQAATMAPAAAQTALTTARQAAPAVVQRAQQMAAPVVRAAEAVRERIAPAQAPEGFGARNIGAAELAQAEQRTARAQMMPVPFEGEAALTRGQATRDFGQIQFEKETAKVGETGAALRQRAMNQNEVLQQNFDALVDVANPQYIDKQAIGGAVDRALVNRANVIMSKVREAYKKADEAGEMEAPVQMTGLRGALDQVDDMRPFVETELNAIERVAERMGALVRDQDGNLRPGQVTIKQAETLRQYINDSIDWTDKRKARVGGILREGIDQATEGAGGELYAKARALKRQQVQEFENTALTRKLLTTKRGTDERNIALEDVYDRVIVRSSVEEMNKLRSTLLKSGEEGKSAWASLKAQAIEDIKRQGLTQATDERGNQIMTAAGLNKAIQRLDQSGKLDALFGKRQAQTIRDLGDIARDVYTAPPGAVNFSNTASALQVALDSLLTFGVTGIPAPAATALREASKYMRDRQTRNRVREALEPLQKQSGKF
jgi:hypothetical protein